MRNRGSLRFVPLAVLAFVSFSTLVAPPVSRAQSIAKTELFLQSLQAARQAVDEYGHYDNPDELERVNRIGYELAQHSNFDKMPFTFGLVNMAAPNAFALPGGQIFVTRGMLDLKLDDDMLAAVLGHEIIHVTHEHYLKMQRRATLLNLLGNALVIGTLATADRSGPRPTSPYEDPDNSGNLVQGAAAASLIVSELLLRSYSRDNEDQSDEEGQRLAAAAGYDPNGGRRFWQLLEERAPQAREFGYWQTHPFPDERIRAAEIRAADLKPAEAKKNPDEVRKKTQAALHAWFEKSKPDPMDLEFLKAQSLATWPSGPIAEGLRAEKLKTSLDALYAKPLLSRDFGAAIREHRLERNAVAARTPDSPLLAKIDGDIADLEAKAKDAYPRAIEVLESGIYETLFLEAFLSNFPESPRVPEVALALGEAYSRRGDETLAVAQFLRAAEIGPESSAGQRALLGLRNIAPTLTELAALQELADQETDGELRRQSNERLATLSKTFADVAIGAEYLKKFPTGPHASAVGLRINSLAENLLGEVVLYQGVGEALKALDRIQKILTHAPLSPAAAKLRDRALLATEKPG